jgi:hypothetical protein
MRQAAVTIPPKEAAAITKESVVKISKQKDFWAGLMFIAFGLLAIVVAHDYPMGTAVRMGPGYFPTYLGAIMMVIGAITAGGAYRAQGNAVERWGWRPLLWLSAAFAAFGVIIESAGFVLALLALIIASSLAGRDTRPLELAVLIAVLITGSVALFVYALELPYRLFPWS